MGYPPGAGVPARQGPRLSVGDALGYAWSAYKANLGALIVLALVVVGVQVLLSLVQLALAAGTDSGSSIVAGTFGIAGILFTLLAWVVGFVVAIGLIRAGLAVLDGRTPAASLLLEGQGLATYIIAAILFSLGTFVGLIACIIPGLILAFLWQFYGYAIVDGGTSVSATGSLGRSFQVVKNNIGELLVLWIVIVGIGFLVGLGSIIPFVGWLILGVAGLVLYPVVALALAYAWRTLTNGVVAPQR